MRLCRGDPFVGGLLEADAREEHLVRLGKLGGRAAAEFGLLQQQMRLGCCEVAAQAGDGGVQRGFVGRKFCEDRSRPRCPSAIRSQQGRYR